MVPHPTPFPLAAPLATSPLVTTTPPLLPPSVRRWRNLDSETRKIATADCGSATAGRRGWEIRNEITGMSGARFINGHYTGRRSNRFRPSPPRPVVKTRIESRVVSHDARNRPTFRTGTLLKPIRHMRVIFAFQHTS